MAQTASVPAPAAPAARALPLESFLATDDPVWVWDGQGRRIVWANAAAAKLWGDATPERLKRRRTGKTRGAPARLTELARSGKALGDHAETLRVPTPRGDVPVSCVFQRLQLAGNRPGLVVRVLTEREEAETPAEIAVHPAAELAETAPQNPARKPPQPQKTPRKTATRSDIGALKAIARDLGDAKGLAQASAAGTQKPATKAPAKSARKPASTSGSAGQSKRKSQRKTESPVPEPSPPSGEEMTALLARVSHEIRNPLTIILGFAEILKSDRADRLPPGKAKEYASDIHRTAQLALGLADDLLGFAERANGEPPPHDWFDLNALIADCLHLLEPVATAQGVTLMRRLKRGAPLLLAHERSVRQILLNLLMNALRHGDGGKQIRVMTRLDREGGLILSVKDDGPGMTPAQIAAAKAPEEAQDVKAAGRRGLGLRLVLGFVRDNQGQLDIISKPGEGTDVRIRFEPERLRMPKPRKAKRRPQKGKRK
ncbi:ATP-binding protein [Dichotomicrobium thermohalophilum]|uniref:histidine kinase n=1 Tax=Dichotomicrobium thermohalophilum TaxID=933063 RepID=A0A397Q4U6_9HYPH|nr:ATP-binding protein [Dichotomicrobium thermohalophilum]RIA55439.1 PAS domain-containing protein [Dichotomicrobium thermohalophilum]